MHKKQTSTHSHTRTHTNTHTHTYTHTCLHAHWCFDKTFETTICVSRKKQCSVNYYRQGFNFEIREAGHCCSARVEILGPLWGVSSGLAPSMECLVRGKETQSHGSVQDSCFNETNFDLPAQRLRLQHFEIRFNLSKLRVKESMYI